MKRITGAVNWILIFVLIGGFAMARGTPDEGQNLSSSPTTQVSDLGEQATRLLMGGGANSRSGRWLWATGFESGTAEFQLLGGTLPVIDTTTAYMGRASLKMAPVGLNATSIFSKSLFVTAVPNAPSYRVGVECMIGLSNFAALGNDFEFWWTINSQIPGTLNRGNYTVKLQITADHTGQLFYRNNAGAYVPFANVGPHLIDAASLFRYGKLTVDINTGFYTRFVFGNEIFDLSQFPGILGVGNERYTQYELRAVNLDAATTPIVNLDNVIMTADEP